MSIALRHRGARAFRIAAATLVAAMISASGAGLAIADSPAKVVKMSDTPPRYLPGKVTIKVGDSVEWDNNVSTLHTVTANPDSQISPGDVELPKGAEPFDSGFMAPNGTFTHKFTVPGTYKYFCLPHEKDGMLGTVIVEGK